MITRAFIKEPYISIDLLKSKIEFLSNHWQSCARRRPLKWFAEEKVRLGAFSTLLGIKFITDLNNHADRFSFSAIAIGDSCLFHVRNNNLICSFPLTQSVEFSNSPLLISSNLNRNLHVWDEVKFLSNPWQLGDIFLLATDSLSHWLISQVENNLRPWEIFINICNEIHPEDVFSKWVHNQRVLSHLKNDDITLIIIKN
jgi:hypothetical protein